MAIEPSVQSVGEHGQRAAIHGTETAGLSGYQLATKRSFDLLLSSILLVATSPIWLTVGLAVKLSSRGPVFFRLPAVGRDGKVFAMYKFRSMVTGAHAQFHSVTSEVHSGPMAKVLDDPRVTRVGRFIRRFSLDELPQLLNVIRGEMSIVGPRALSASRYDEDLRTGWQGLRLKVLPGMTGVWQTSGRVQDFEACCKLDIDYIDSWTIWKDIVIIAKTPFAMLSHRGAG
jgi:lipopolysaccharide/colanic/teichoic acid biosynthesis glycosyltransferase